MTAPFHVRQKLIRLRSRMKMGADTSFGMPDSGVYDVEGRYLGTVDEFIKERTRLWRESWILPVIEDLLGWADGKPKT